MSVKPTGNGRETPWINAWARPVVRLHPSPDEAERTDSHVGNHDLSDEQVRCLHTPFAGCVQLFLD